jgi:hypothetical protein
MTLFEGLTVDQLNRLLSLSRWGLGIFGVLTAVVGVLNQYVSERIAEIQKGDKEEAAIRQKAAEETLTAVRVEAESARKLAAELETRQKPRILPDELVQAIIQTAAQATGKDDLQISCVVGDPEAWALAEQLKAAFVAAGFRFERIVPVITTPPVIGLSVSARDVSPSPLHACIAALMRHFGLPLSAAPTRDGEKPWTITVGRKP